MPRLFFDRADCHSPFVKETTRYPLQTLSILSLKTPFKPSKMSFLFGGGRPQLSSAEKIAAAETEVEMISDMFNRYFLTLAALSFEHCS